MWDFSFGRSLGLMVQTLPFILLRILVYFAVAMAFVLATGLGAGLGWAFGAFGDAGFRATASFSGGAIGFGIIAFVAYWFREYVLYLVKAGHIAVMVELLDGRPMPEGRSQIGHAQAMVRERFAEASVLFGVDQLVKGVLRTITGLVRGIFTLIPIPGIRQLTSVLHAFLRMAVGFIDEVILAHALRTRATNPWASARIALVFYGQNHRNMLKNAAWITLFVYGLTLVMFFVMLAPAAVVANLYPGGLSALGVVLAVVFAWAVKAAVFEPLAVACLLQAYFRAIEGQTPDPEWEQRLDGMSQRFRDLKDRALRATGAAPPPQPGPA